MKRRITFFSVFKSNLKCAVCKNKKCRVRYLPDRKRIYPYNGVMYTDECPKDKEKKFNKIGKKMKRRK